MKNLFIDTAKFLLFAFPLLFLSHFYFTIQHQGYLESDWRFTISILFVFVLLACALCIKNPFFSTKKDDEEIVALHYLNLFVILAEVITDSAIGKSWNKSYWREIWQNDIWSTFKVISFSLYLNLIAATFLLMPFELSKVTEGGMYRVDQGEWQTLDKGEDSLNLLSFKGEKRLEIINLFKGQKTIHVFYWSQPKKKSHILTEENSLTFKVSYEVSTQTLRDVNMSGEDFSKVLDTKASKAVEALISLRSDNDPATFLMHNFEDYYCVKLKDSGIKNCPQLSISTVKGIYE